jgi:hypothetical protein
VRKGDRRRPPQEEGEKNARKEEGRPKHIGKDEGDGEGGDSKTKGKCTKWYH